jgi:hypothetical protein
MTCKTWDPYAGDHVGYSLLKYGTSWFDRYQCFQITCCLHIQGNPQEEGNIFFQKISTVCQTTQNHTPKDSIIVDNILTEFHLKRIEGKTHETVLHNVENPVYYFTLCFSELLCHISTLGIHF